MVSTNDAEDAQMFGPVFGDVDVACREVVVAGDADEKRYFRVVSRKKITIFF